MSIYTINSETELAGGAVADADELVVYDADTKITKKVQMDSVRQYCGGGIVNVTDGTVSLTAAAHANRIVTLNRLAGVTVTLPAATGTGDTYTIVIGTAATSNANIIETSATTEHMAGIAIAADDDTEGAGTAHVWNCETSDDTITMDGTATGGKVGDIITIKDYAATIFNVTALLTQSGGSEVTPFSAAVS